MSIQVGERVPAGTLTRMTEGGPAPVSTDDVFKGKKVVLFAVPGAFTPTCSNKHLPGYLKQYDAFRAKGVDTIACVSVNDAWVMQQWAESQGAGDKILMLADGNGDFTKAMGLEMDGSGFGLGGRSRRYAAIVENGVITSLEVEEGGGISVSACENISAKL